MIVIFHRRMYLGPYPISMMELNDRCLMGFLRMKVYHTENVHTENLPQS